MMWQIMWHLWMWMVYLLLLFCDLSYCCGSAEYFINGECCPMCSPGEHVYRHCTEYTSTSCKPCTAGSFMAVPNGLLYCITCAVCDPGLGLKTARECSRTSDAMCGTLDQHYCTEADKKGCRLAQRHTICRPGTLIKRNGTILTNTECEECRDKTFSNESSLPFCKPHTDCQSLGLQEITAGTDTSDSVCGPRNDLVAVVVPVVLVLVAGLSAVIGIFISRKRKKGKQNGGIEQPQDEERRMKNTETERKDLFNQPQDEVLQGRQKLIPACRREEGMHPGQVTSPLQST
ncbi:tumor necrosis factor receptor superfamily member 14-like isoform X2 [Conger conger]|uniref:tumor necrosis factor receptor superfamily member 14-like isoform X2 n=1 Tax=Conger conger TaxID=82655 RepID=UPI002A5AB230|nr:tumor necrosis factor receptor superfamily member 14-like isoform X2 [Conger conger]